MTDHYFDGPYQVFTELHHLRRGSCCGHGCRHCPFEPKACAGATRVREEHRGLIGIPVPGALDR